MPDTFQPPTDARSGLCPWRRDWGLAAGVTLAQVVGTHLAARGQPERGPIDALGYVLLVVSGAALVARRRRPVAVLWFVLAATLVYWVRDEPRGPIFFALIVAFVTAVQAGHRAAAVTSLAVGYVSFLWLPDLVGRGSAPTLAAAVGLAAWHLLLFGGAELVRVRRLGMQEAARLRQEAARRRAGEERMRIARELHDVLAHNISMINVQAGVALHLMDERPEQARTALTAIKAASKEALVELRSVLGVLRQVDEEAPLVPTAGLARVPELVDRARAAGLTLDVKVVGEERPLPTGVDLAAFRIAQEALTNVARHAGPVPVTLRVEYGDDALVVEVRDRGPSVNGRPPDGDSDARTVSGGNGIPGMRERAIALGGRLDAGPVVGGGFRVRAELPLEHSDR